MIKESKPEPLSKISSNIENNQVSGSQSKAATAPQMSKYSFMNGLNKTMSTQSRGNTRFKMMQNKITTKKVKNQVYLNGSTSKYASTSQLPRVNSNN